MSRLGAFCGQILEAGWLAVIVAAPLYFNVYTSRVFEPDKATLLRNLSVALAVVWLLWWLEARASGVASAAPFAKRLRAAAQANPLLLPAALVVVANVVATLFSVVPHISLWGSYLRLQGLLTTLCYIVVYAIIAVHLRREEQAQRFVTTAILVSVPVGLYGIIQRFKLDPLLWGQDVSQRVTSTMGNPIFLSAFMLLVTPLVVARLAQAVAALRAAPSRPLAVEGPAVARLAALVLAQNVALFLVARLTAPGNAHFWAYMPMLGVFLLLLPFIRAPQPGKLLIGAQIVGYSLVLLIHLVTAVLSQSRGPWLGLLAGVALVLLLLAVRGAPRVVRVGLFGALVGGLLALVGMNVPGTPLEGLKQVPQVGRLANLAETETGTGRVRLLVWQASVELLTQRPAAGLTPDGFSALRPLVGYGPESFYFTFTKVFPPELWLWEGYGSTPDRAHNEIIDQLAMQGALGLLSWLLAMHVGLLLALRLLGLVPPGRLWPLLILLSGVVGVGVVVLRGLLRRERAGTAVPLERYVLVAGLLAALVGHFVEVQSGIAIVATRTYAWAMLGVLAALWQMAQQPHPAPEGAPASVAAAARSASATAPRRPRSGRPAAEAGPLRGGPWWLVLAYGSAIFVELLFLRAALRSDVAGAVLLLGQVLLLVAVGLTAILLGPPLGGLAWRGRLWPSVVAAVLALWVIVGNTTLVAADAVYKEAQAFVDAHRSIEALPMLQRAAQMAPREDYFYLRLGGAFLEMAQAAPAGRTEPPPFRDLDDILTLDVAKVRTFKRDDHFGASEIALQHALRLSPLNTDHYANLGRLYLAWGVLSQPERLAQSIEYFERATQQSPHAPQLLQEMARAQVAAKQYDRAAASLAQAQRVMPGWRPDGSLAGDIELARGNVRAALAAYAPTFASIPPPQALADNQVDARLEAILNAGLTDEAIAALVRARDDPQRTAHDPQKRAPSDYAINVALGFLYYRTKRLPEAAAAFEAATRAQPEQWLIHRNLGLVYYEMGQRTRALAALQQAQRYAPRSEVAGIQDLLAQLQR